MLRDFMDVFPYYSVLLAIAATKIYMYAHIGVAVFTYIIDFILVTLGCPPFTIVITSSVLAILLRVVCFIHIYRKTKINLFTKQIIQNTIKITLHCSICLVLLVLLKNHFFNTLYPLVILIIAGIVYYVLIILTGKVIKVDYLESLWLFIKKK